MNKKPPIRIKNSAIQNEMLTKFNKNCDETRNAPILEAIIAMKISIQV